MGSSDIEREEEHTGEWQARGWRYKHLVYGVWICEEIDYTKTRRTSVGSAET